jgi:hypothetical protein
MLEYDLRMRLAEQRRRVWENRPGGIPVEAKGGVAAPENADSSSGMGQITQIFDVLDENGLPTVGL